MKKLKKMLGFFVAVSLFALSGCSGGSGDTVSSDSVTGSSENTVVSSTNSDGEKIVVYALNSTWSRLMPYDLNGMNMIAPNDKVFDKLTYVTEDGIGMRAAESIEMEDGGSTFVIKLRQGSLWHDGEPVTSADWLWTYQTISSKEFPATASKSYLSNFTGTDDTGTVIDGESIGIEAPDDYTLIFHLKDASYPGAFFTAYGNYLSVLPKHLLEDIPVAELNENEFWSHPIGSGPCKYVSDVAGSELVLEAFDDYYLGRPQFDKLIYKVVDTSSMPSALISGEIDTCYPFLTPSEALALDGQNGLHVELSMNTTNHMLSVNNEIFPQPVRKAFSLLIDKQLILDSLFEGKGMVAESYISPSSPYYDDSLTFERNVEEAKKLLDEAGFDYSKTYTIGASTPVREKIALIIQQNFADAGITLEITTGDNSGMLKAAKEGTVDMNIMSWGTTSSPTYNMAYHNNNASSFSRIQDTVCFDMMRAVNTAETDEERIELMKQLQETYQEECWYVPLVHQYNYIVLAENLNGLDDAKTDACWLWEVK